MMLPTSPHLQTMALTLLLCGCLGCHHQQIAPPPRPVSMVDVGGFVGHPGSIEIPVTGLTLQQAIFRAGGASYQSLGFMSESRPLRSETLVRLQRGSEAWHFPLSLVELDLAGAVQLFPGDCVQLVLVGDTPIAINLGDENRSVKYTSNKPLRKTPSNGKIEELLKTASEFEQDTSNTIVVITRSNPRNGTVLEHYFLTTENYGYGDQVDNRSARDTGLQGPKTQEAGLDDQVDTVAAADTQPQEPKSKEAGQDNGDKVSSRDTLNGNLGSLLDGDQLTYTSLGQIPLIQAGLLAPSLKRLIDSGVPREECFRQLRILQNGQLP